MIIRARAPLRIGFAGGGTDVSPYCDNFGGAILNATINMYAYATIEPRLDNKIELISKDQYKNVIYESAKELPLTGDLALLKGVYNRLIKDYIKEPLSFTLTTYVDTPIGSGLGASSTLVVAILKAFQEWKKIPLGNYDIANLAYIIEREDLKFQGGRQDQYAAAFGGFNFMEFSDSKVIVNPLKINKDYINELEFNTLLYYTGTSRFSSKIIETQSVNTKNNNPVTINSFNKIKEYAYATKKAFLTGNIDEIGIILNESWEYKKKTSSAITNEFIDNIYKIGLNAGAIGGKISGAGGGGFMLFYCPKVVKYDVMNALQDLGGEFRNFNFTNFGAESWIS
jgi:D-glycero-alpha-D-manno-heptose-7-phosphate kinase